MNNSKLYTLIILCFCLPLALISCGGGDDDSDDDGLAYAKKPLSLDADIVNHELLQIHAISGSVEVTGDADADSIIIAGEMRVGSSSLADAEDYLDELSVELTDLGNEIFVETIQPEISAGRNYIVDYIVTVPKNLEVNVKQVNGSVFIKEINNQVTVGGANSDVDLKNIVGSTSVTAANGRIDSEITLPEGGTIKMSFANGDINLRIPKVTSAMFNANVANGDINMSGLSLQDEVDIFNSLSGTLGEGKGDIDLTTGNGDITVTGF